MLNNEIGSQLKNLRESKGLTIAVGFIYTLGKLQSNWRNIRETSDCSGTTAGALGSSECSMTFARSMITATTGPATSGNGTRTRYSQVMVKSP